MEIIEVEGIKSIYLAKVPYTGNGYGLYFTNDLIVGIHNRSPVLGLFFGQKIINELKDETKIEKINWETAYLVKKSDFIIYKNDLKEIELQKPTGSMTMKIVSGNSGLVTFILNSGKKKKILVYPEVYQKIKFLLSKYYDEICTEFY